MSTPTFKEKLISSGQPRAYADSVSVYEITSDSPATEDQVWAFVETLSKVRNRVIERRQFDGSCGFPHGLNAFHGLWPKKQGGWDYRIVSPYCD